MHLTFHLTKRCNMRCSYCYAPPVDGPGVSSEVIEATLRLGASWKQRTCGIVFFGGEPLLEWDAIRETVDRAKAMERDGSCRFYYKITTNGVLLDDEVLDYAQDNDLLVAMSFDGVQQAQDAHRRFPGGKPTYAFLRDRLAHLLERRPYSSVLMVVTPETGPFLAESVHHALDLGARYLVISPNLAATWTEDDIEVLRVQYEQLADAYIEWTEAGRKFYISPFEVKLASHIRCDQVRKDQCELGNRQLSVDPDGNLYPCVQFTADGPDGPWCIGNVFDGVDEAARLRIHDLSDATKSECAGCALLDRCHNTCGCLNWQTTGSVNRVSPVLCAYEQMLFPIVDRVGERLYAKGNRSFLMKHYDDAWPVRSLIEDLAAGKRSR